jgi:adenine phosphoribosyltransferase
MTTHSVREVLNATTVPRLGTDRRGRNDRIIHSLDGLLNPASPTAVAEIADLLWKACREGLGISTANCDYILGLEAGGMIPAVALAAASGLHFKIAWKIQLALPGAVQFIEPHSARRDMYAYAIAPGQRILLVDDEITTGRTLANLVCVLREADAEPIGAACLIEDPRHNGRELLADLGVPLVSLMILDPTAA